MLLRDAPCPDPPRARRFRRRLLAASAFCLVLLSGCGAPGEPVPRIPDAPEPVSDLAAHQQGEAVVLTFTLPDVSTRGEPLAQPPAVEILRGGAASGAAPREDTALRLIATIPADLVPDYERNGLVEYHDPIDPVDIAGPPVEMIYRVRTRVSNRGASTDSNTVSQRLYPPPGPVSGLRATVSGPSVILAWAEPPGPLPDEPLVYRVYRSEIAPDSPGAPQPLELLDETSDREYRDISVVLGRSYLYVVRRAVRPEEDLVESADSPPVVAAITDVMPPAVPQQVQAVVVPGTPEAPPSLDLVWAIGTEDDLAGYVVSRSESPGEEGQRLNPELLPAPVFRDTTVMPGHRYFYRVRAVDQAGNESPPTEPVAAELP